MYHHFNSPLLDILLLFQGFYYYKGTGITLWHLTMDMIFWVIFLRYIHRGGMTQLNAWEKLPRAKDVLFDCLLRTLSLTYLCGLGLHSVQDLAGLLFHPGEAAGE